MPYRLQDGVNNSISGDANRSADLACVLKRNTSPLSRFAWVPIPRFHKCARSKRAQISVWSTYVHNCKAQNNLIKLGDDASAPRQEAVIHFLLENVPSISKVVVNKKTRHCNRNARKDRRRHSNTLKQHRVLVDGKIKSLPRACPHKGGQNLPPLPQSFWSSASAYCLVSPCSVHFIRGHPSVVRKHKRNKRRIFVFFEACRVRGGTRASASWSSRLKIHSFRTHHTRKPPHICTNHL